MVQNYEIFLKHIPVVITNDPPTGTHDANDIMVVYAHSNYNLKPTIDEIEANHQFHAAYFITPDPDNLFKQFQSHFHPVEAAGGIVWSPQGAILMIFRHGKWDLPKGKIEDREQVAEAAQREVSEECGVHKLHLNYFYGTSYHTYWQHNQRKLKITYWYDMICEEPENINPQTEEGIETIRWMDSQGLQRAMANTFPNLHGILSNYLAKVAL